ncbi:MAG: hypothetical protein WBQ14_01640 [Gaiellaceae bacterium]
MSLRFLTNLTLASLGAALVVFSMALGSATVGWIAFGISIGIIALLAAVQPLRGRGIVQRSLDGLVGILAAWTIVASLIFAGTTLTWLMFGSGLGFVGLAYAGLVLHEVRTEHVVHTLAPAEEQERERERERERVREYNRVK